MSSTYSLVVFLGLVIVTTSTAAANGGATAGEDEPKVLSNQFYPRIKNKPTHEETIKPRDSQPTMKPTMYLSEEISKKTVKQKTAGCPPAETAMNGVGTEETPKHKPSGCPPGATVMNVAGLRQEATFGKAAEEIAKIAPGVAAVNGHFKGRAYHRTPIPRETRD